MSTVARTGTIRLINFIVGYEMKLFFFFFRISLIMRRAIKNMISE